MGNEAGIWIMHGVKSSDPKCIHTVDEAMRYINQVGFLPLFANCIPGFSLEERTIPEDWWCGDIEHDPWEWREIIARRNQIAYGKFFDRKAGFISKEWLPYFANYRRDGYDFDSLWDDEKASRRQKKIMDLFEGAAEWYSYEIKDKAGFGKGGEKNFEGVITGLQMQTYLCVKDFRQKKNRHGVGYGMDVAIYCKPEHIWGYETVTSAYSEDPDESALRIMKHMQKISPSVTPEQIRKVLGIGKRK